MSTSPVLIYAERIVLSTRGHRNQLSAHLLIRECTQVLSRAASLIPYPPVDETFDKWNNRTGVCSKRVGCTVRMHKKEVS